MLGLMIALAAELGPIAKLGAEAPTAVIRTAKRLEDIERCMLDAPGVFVPTVYRQPDRPDQSMLLWMASPSGGGLPVGRVDLKRDQDGTRVTIWMPKFKHPEKLLECVNTN